MSETSFVFQWTVLSAAISIVALAVVCILSWFAWQRSGFRASVGGLELLRVSIVGFAAFLLNQPESVEEFKPREKPVVAILGDQSLSDDHSGRRSWRL